jgi:hypothetical protein
LKYLASTCISLVICNCKKKRFKTKFPYHIPRFLVGFVLLNL